MTAKRFQSLAAKYGNRAVRAAKKAAKAEQEGRMGWAKLWRNAQYCFVEGFKEQTA